MLFRLKPIMQRWLGIVLLGAMCSSLPAHPTDRLPRGDWTYDAMASLASRGLLPGTPPRIFYDGEKLFTRLEMAQILAKALEEAARDRKTALGHDPLFERLGDFLAPELESLGALLPEPTLPVPPERERFFIGGYVRGRLVSDRKDEDTTEGLFRVTALADLAPRWIAGATLTDEKRDLPSGQEILFPQQVKPDQEAFSLPNRRFLKDNFPVLDKFFVRGYAGRLGVEAGRSPIRWGPSYTGGMLLSENAPNLTSLRLTLPLSLGFLGRWNVEHFYTTWKQDGQRVYLVGRRLEHKFGGKWYFGFSETLKSSKTPNFLAASFLPLVAYQKIYEDDEINFNILLNFDLAYRDNGGKEYYGEFLIDDYPNPFDPILYGRSSKTPQKIGYLLGVYLPAVGSQDTSLRLEYIYATAGTYLHKNILLSYTFDQMVLGHPIGTNANAIFVRIEHRFSSKLSAAVAGLIQRSRGPKPEVGNRNIGILSISYDLTRSQTLGLKWFPYEISDGRGKKIRSNRVHLEGTYLF